MPYSVEPIYNEHKAKYVQQVLLGYSIGANIGTIIPTMNFVKHYWRILVSYKDFTPKRTHLHYALSVGNPTPMWKI